MIDWLFRTTIEVTVLVGLVLILRPFVRRQLGASSAYWLWLIPLVRCLMWSKPELPLAVLQRTYLPGGEIYLHIIPNLEILLLSADLHLERFWIAGVLLWITVRIIGWWRLQVYLKANSQIFSLSEELQSFAKLQCPSVQITFLTTPIPAAPFVTGLIKPQIFLPEDFFERYTEAQQKWILTHELTHLRRKDLWLQLVAELIRALFWFNPIVHLAWFSFREDQELACDQQVLRDTNENERYEYGHALAKGFDAHVLPATLAFFNRKTERFIMLEKHRSSVTRNLLGISLCLLIGTYALTKAPRAIADQGSRTKEAIFLDYENIPLDELTRQVFSFAEQEVVGLELLNSYLVTVKIESVKPLDVANLLLRCHGYAMEDQGSFYQIVQHNQIDTERTGSKECIDSGLAL